MKLQQIIVFCVFIKEHNFLKFSVCSAAAFEMLNTGPLNNGTKLNKRFQCCPMKMTDLVVKVASAHPHQPILSPPAGMLWGQV